jgi:hypothetical protein
MRMWKCRVAWKIYGKGFSIEKATVTWVSGGGELVGNCSGVEEGLRAGTCTVEGLGESRRESVKNDLLLQGPIAY